MKKGPFILLCLFLAMGVKVQGTTLYSTFNTNSTEGNYYGGLYFSFSSTNRSDYAQSSPGHGYWFPVSGTQGFTDLASGVQISVSLEAGLAEAPNEFNLLLQISIIDPTLGTVDRSSPPYTFFAYDESGGDFEVGQPTPTYPSRYGGGETMSFHSYTLNMNGNFTFSYTLPVVWDGISGNAVGSWLVNYTVPPISPTPEPAVTLELALGGVCLWLARARHQQRRRN